MNATQGTVTPAQRHTKYCQAIQDGLIKLGHATNAELLKELRQAYPNLSATTIHRATARLAQAGKIGIAPADIDGSMRYDAKTSPHDHFLCQDCGLVRDTDVKSQLMPALEASIDGCRISGRLTISGDCQNCLKK